MMPQRFWFRATPCHQVTSLVVTWSLSLWLCTAATWNYNSPGRLPRLPELWDRGPVIQFLATVLVHIRLRRQQRQQQQQQ
mmetsp:Transcript_114502/g.318825  ORF Transcript_114502/g.318825 Transcript_114502/m.318825 type:complete len:80 (+) Transcript_114502:478-717(+)